MSLQVNLSSRDLTQAYEDVVNARGIDWAIFTYDKGSNDLKVQATGDGGLEELQEEFSDGRYVSLLIPPTLVPTAAQNAVCVRSCQGPKCEPSTSLSRMCVVFIPPLERAPKVRADQLVW